MKSKQEISIQFKEENPDCEFSVSTIIREFPQFAVTPTTRDLERNTCPTHANARRLIKVINVKLQKNNMPSLPTSCRAFVGDTLCKGPLITEDPKTWSIECLDSKCNRCPGLIIHLPKDVLKEPTVFSQWASKKQTVLIKGEQKEKYIFSLYTETSSLKEAIDRLNKMTNKLALHIYTAAKQWEAHVEARNHLDKESIITIEDYQMNLEAVYTENPTSMAYSSNKVTVALYPICVEYIDANGDLKKGAISFLTDDKVHDHQQVRNFEKRMFEILKEKLGRSFKYWKRFSDGCDGQFRSRYTVADLMKAPKRFNCDIVSFDYFEANEGKNISDTIGSIIKCAYIRGMHKTERGVHNVKDIIEIVKSELQSNMKNFSFFIVGEFGETERIVSRDECKIDAIMKKHSLVAQEGKIITRRWTCENCTVSVICQECKESNSFVDARNVVLGTDDDNILIEKVKDPEDEGQTDGESNVKESDVETEDQEETIQSGDIILGLSG